jgi:ferredoxin
MAMKAHDCYSAALCVGCHSEIDQGKKLTYEERKELWEAAWRKTILVLCEEGKLKPM